MTAGLLLGSAELMVLRLVGVRLDPGIGLAFVLAATLAVALPTFFIAAVVSGGERRPLRSEMICGLIGPILFAPALGTLVGLFSGVQPFGLRTGVWILVAAVVATLAAAGSARTAQHMEESGWWLPGPAIWLLAAILTASASRVSVDPGFAARGAAVGSAAVVLALAYGASVFLRARRRPRRPPWPPARSVALTALLCAAAVAGERALPFLLLSRDLPVLIAGPPHVLVLGFGPSDVVASETGAGSTSLALLSADGVSYERVRSGSRAPALGELFALPGGRSVLGLLQDRGYATAVYRTDPALPPLADGLHHAIHEGGEAVLRRHAAQTAGGGVLLAFGSRGLAAIGLAGLLRDPDVLRAEARRWLQDWRIRRAPVPFALIVDYARGDGRNEPGTVEAELAAWQRELFALGLEGDTLVLVTAPVPQAARRAVIARPPARVRLEAPGASVERLVRPARFAEAIREASEDTTATLPGLPEVRVAAGPTPVPEAGPGGVGDPPR